METPSKETTTLESNKSTYTYVNKGFSMNAKNPSPDRIYVVPETSHSSIMTNPASLNLGKELVPIITGSRVRTRLSLTPPNKLDDEDIDGLSSRYQHHHLPFRSSSLQQSRDTSRSQLRIKRWWLNSFPNSSGSGVTGTFTGADTGPGITSSGIKVVANISTTTSAIPITCTIGGSSTSTKKDDSNQDEEDVRFKPHV